MAMPSMQMNLSPAMAPPYPVSRTRCSALSAFTRVFVALWRCTADAGSHKFGVLDDPGSAAHHFELRCPSPLWRLAWDTWLIPRISSSLRKRDQPREPCENLVEHHADQPAHHDGADHVGD